MKDNDLPYQGEELSMLIPLPMAVNGLNHLDILHAMAINGINDLIEAILTSHKGRYCQTQSKNVEFFFQSLNWRVTLNWSSFKFSRQTKIRQSFAEWTKVNTVVYVYINEVYHIASVEKTEDGSDAAAATAV